MQTSLPAVPLIYHPIYSQLQLPQRHRFPIQKYQALRDALGAMGIPRERFLRPRPLAPGQLKGPLCPRYVEAFVNGTLSDSSIRRMGFPWSTDLVARTLTAVAGTVLAGSLSLERGRAVNLTGGYHHAFFDEAAGFCIFNDLYLSAINLLDKPGIGRVLIFDCDVHQGDGTARLAANNPAIATVSIHGEKNFPFHKQRSDLDVGLPRGTGDDEYLDCVDRTFTEALERFRPDAVIYDAGVDIHTDDELGHFQVSGDGVLARDRLVFKHCDRAGLPVSAVIGGGYQRDIPALAALHTHLFRAALSLP